MQKGKDGYLQVNSRTVFININSVFGSNRGFEPDQWVDVVDHTTDVITSPKTVWWGIKHGERIIDTYIWQHDDKPPQNYELVMIHVWGLLWWRGTTTLAVNTST